MDRQTNRKHAKGCEMDQAQVVGFKTLLGTLWGGSCASQHKPAASLSDSQAGRSEGVGGQEVCLSKFLLL